MSIRTLKSYEIITESQAKLTVVAEDLKKAACAIDDTIDPITSVKFLARDIKVFAQDADVEFKTSVSPAEAATAGCKAFPLSFTVANGQAVIFTASAADGYAFVNWSRNGVVLSTQAEASLPVTSITSGETMAEYVATFVAT